MKSIFPFGVKPAERPVASAVAPAGQSVDERLLALERRGNAEEAEAEVINDIARVPVGDYIDLTTLEKKPLATVQAAGFAAIASSNGTSYLLATETSEGRMVMEAFARLRINTEGAVVRLRASADVIRIVNERNQKMTADTALSETEIEMAARQLLLDAERRGTSDIHIETRENHVEVYFRIHGKRMRMGDLSMKRAHAICNFLYDWKSSDSSRGTGWNKADVQDTMFAMDMSGGKGILNVRFHSAPIHPQGNHQTVMRLLRPASSSGGFRPLRDVGYTPEQTSEIMEMISGGSGIVLIVGPTNSGKSTSLQSAVRAVQEIRGETIKISTIENPVEYEMTGACQMAASSENFDKYLKASLRQDPDVVVVGEIRDADAAETTKNLVLAGHKIFSTLHVYEAPTAFARLIQLGVPRGLLAMPGFISGVVYQRLVPVVCPHCSHKYIDIAGQGILTEELERRLSRTVSVGEDDVRFARVGGCEHCDFLGVVGRTPCAEVLKPDATFLDMVRREDDAGAKAYWLSQMGSRIGMNGTPTALSHAKLKMRQGLLDPRDVEAELSLLTSEN